MKLQENISRIREMMGLVNEQSPQNTLKPNPGRPIPMPSDRLGPEGSYEEVEYSKLPKDEYFEMVRSIPPKSIKRVRLIFPQQNWETKALEYLKKLGVVTGVYKSLSQAKKFILNLSSKQITTNELVIGSHGDEGTLLSTKVGEYFYFNNSFVNDLKGIVNTNTTVFFTACYGADYLLSLKDAAEKLGVGAYGSSGVYNYVTNSSEKGFYYCSANKFTAPTQTIAPYVIEPGELSIRMKHTGEEYSEIKVILSKDIAGEEVEFLMGAILKSISSEIPSTKAFYPNGNFISSSEDTTEDSTPTYYGEMKYDTWNLSHMHTSIKDKVSDFTYKKTPFYEFIEKPYGPFVLGSDPEFTEETKNKFKEWFDNGSLKILIPEGSNNTNFVDIKEVGNYTIADFVSNDFLLNNKLCKKVSSSPISWV